MGFSSSFSLARRRSSHRNRLRIRTGPESLLQGGPSTLSLLTMALRLLLQPLGILCFLQEIPTGEEICAGSNR